MLLLQAGDRREIHAGIVANGGMGTASRLDTDDAVCRKRLVADKKLRILAGINVIGNHRHR
jgi:hypothetical protein